MPRRSRGLRPEDIELWHRITRSVARLHPARPALAAEPEAPVATKLHPPRAEPVQRPIEPFLIGQQATATRSHMLVPSLPDQWAAAPVQMDKKAFHRLQKGKLLPEARIDLHGMTLAQAHPALNHFIRQSHADGRRLVLIITGKGKSRDDHGAGPRSHGILKHQVPHWLSMVPLAPLVLQVAEAHVKHGGSGAYYVYLRRHR